MLRSGQVLKSIKPVLRPADLRVANNSSKSSSFLHVSLNSPHLKVLAPSSRNVRGVKFSSSPISASSEKAARDKVWFIPIAKIDTKHLVKTQSKPRTSQDFLGRSLSLKPPHRGGKPPTHLVMYDLLRESSKKGLSLREINRRFGVSKKSIGRLVRNGVLQEEWGARGIGVRYRLSKKGKEQLAAIRETSRITTSRKESFIRLRTRLPI
jgi:predicted DNA-binding transcriptional regulator